MGLFSSSPKKTLLWQQLTKESQVKELWEESLNKPILFFKHRTRCNISTMVLSRFEEKWSSQNELCDIYFLDLLEYRSVSNELAEISAVFHQSPQVILVKNKEVIYSASHSNIDADMIEKLLQ